MIERLNAHKMIHGPQKLKRKEEMKQLVVLLYTLFFMQVFLQVLSFFFNMYQFFFLFYSYHKIIATRDLCLAGDRSAFVSSIQGGFYLFIYISVYI